MKKRMGISLTLLGILGVLGIIQILAMQHTAQTSNRSDQDEISRCLIEIFSNLESERDADGKFPTKLSTDHMSTGGSIGIDDLVYDPNAGEFSALITYQGDRLAARGYCVYPSGIVTNGKMKVRSP